MDNPDPKADLKRQVREVLTRFKAGDFDADVATQYLIHLIETGELTRYEHVIGLRAHD